MNPNVLRLLVAGLAGVLSPLFAETPLGSAPSAARIIFDVDLTRGSAGPGQVTGGEWRDGWRCTGATGERIVFDAGAPIANGRLEVTFTAEHAPWSVTPAGAKANWAGLHEHSSLNQDEHDGDLFYARSGDLSFRFSNIKAAGRMFDRSEWEPRVGKPEDWILDGRTEMKVVFEWRDGVPIFTLPDGQTSVFPRDVVGADTPVDELRYIFLGSDRFTGLTIKGLRFTRVKLVDHGAQADGPQPLPLRVSERRLVTTLRPVVLLADQAPRLLQNTPEEVARYLRERRAQRFNAVLFEPTVPMAPAAVASPDWEPIDEAIAQTRRLGLYAIVQLPGNTPERYTKALAARFRTEPHVLYQIREHTEAEARASVGRTLGREAPEALVGAVVSDGSALQRLKTEDWVDFYAAGPQADFGAVFTAAGSRPVWLLGRREREDDNSALRAEAYRSVLLGGFGYAFGSAAAGEANRGTTSPAAETMRHFAKVMNSFGRGDTLTRFADASVARNLGASSDARETIVVSRTPSLGQVTVYAPTGQPIGVKLEALADDNFFAWWFNPRSGRWHKDGAEYVRQTLFAMYIEGGPGAIEREFKPPTSGPGQDWLLILSLNEGI